MKHAYLRLFAVACAILMLSGCAPDPGDICDKLDEIFEVSKDKPALLSSHKACVASFESKKKRHGVNSYRREAECILAATKPYEATQCMESEDK